MKPDISERSETGLATVYDQLTAAVSDVEDAWTLLRWGSIPPRAQASPSPVQEDLFVKAHSLAGRLRELASEIRGRA